MIIWKVRSSSDPMKLYKVTSAVVDEGRETEHDGWTCECPGYLFRIAKDPQTECRHIKACIATIDTGVRRMFYASDYPEGVEGP